MNVFLTRNHARGCSRSQHLISLSFPLDIITTYKTKRNKQAKVDMIEGFIHCLTSQGCESILQIPRGQTFLLEINTFDTNKRHSHTQIWIHFHEKIQTSVPPKILQVRGPEQLLHQDLWQRTGYKSILATTGEHRQRWAGNVLHRDQENTALHAPDWNPPGPHRRGLPGMEAGWAVQAPDPSLFLGKWGGGRGEGKKCSTQPWEVEFYSEGSL